MSEQNLHEKAQRGRRAQDIIEDPLVIEAFEQIEDKIVEEWKASGPKDDDLRKRCKDRYDSLQIFRVWFQDVIVKGSNAKSELAHLEKESGIKRMFK